MTRWWCRRYRPLLVDHADGALDASRRQQLEHHLRRCPRCRVDFGALRELPDLLQTSTVPDPGDAFWLQQRQAIGRAIRSSAQPGAGWVRDVTRFGVWRYPIAATAGLVVALAVYQAAQRPPDISGSPVAAQLAALDTDALLMLNDLAAAVAPADEGLPDGPQDEEVVVAAADLVGVQELSAVPSERGLNDTDIEGVGELIGNPHT